MEEEFSQNKHARNVVHPKEQAGILSTIFFCWAFPLFKKGLTKDLNEDDLCAPLKSHRSKDLGDKLEEAWRKEVETKKNPSLWKSIIAVFWKESALFGIIVLVEQLVIKMAQPLLIGRFLSYYTPNQTEVSKKDAYIYGICLSLTSLINVLILHSITLGLQHLGMKMRIAVCSLIYRKSLKLSKLAMAETTTGQMVNLLANDAKRFDTFNMHFHHLWLAPIESIIIIYLLYVTVNPIAIAGISVLIAFVPLQVYIARKISQYRLSTALKSDQRVRLMHEIISGIQVIKTYTWEKPFEKLVAMSRKLEIREIRGASFLRAIAISFMLFLNRSAVFVCVLTYVLLGNNLKAEYVFVVTSFYGMLRQVITMWMPRGVSNLAETHISVHRIQKFLNCHELHSKIRNRSVILNGDSSEKLRNHKFSVNLKDASVKWSAECNDYVLNEIDLTVKPKELVALIGPVGSGKSTLLQVILKELPLLKGKLEIFGTISYASQEPWLFAGSIKQNILFGQAMEPKRYKEIVKVCSLERDFSLFPHGDLSIIGERGVMLSGGQKARISLARTIYKNADIYLLDDPLSAVDAHVGKELYDRCIRGFLKDKCRLLVTHQLQYLANVDRIYLLENGRNKASGTYDELKNCDSDFVKLLHNATAHHDEIKSEGDNSNDSNEAKSNEDIKSLGSLPSAVKEQRSSGQVSKSIYESYFKAGGNWCYSALVFVFFILAQIGASGTDYFLTFWVNTEQKRYEFEIHSTGIDNVNDNQTGIYTRNVTQMKFDETYFEMFLTTSNCLYVYSSLIFFIIIITLTSTLTFMQISMRASINLHNAMFSRIVYAPMRFFNTNPSGRILNRFSRDMGLIDENLPVVVIDTIQLGLKVIFITLVICSVNVWILIPTVIICGIFYCYRYIFVATSRDLKRLDGITRSPVFSHLTASIQGLTTIRAFRAEDILMNEFDSHQDLHSSAHYLFIGANRTFGFWLDINCVIYIALVILSFLFIATETYAGNVGLTITQSITLTGMVQWGMRQWSDLENQMTSVERVVEYTETETEFDGKRKSPPTNWPSDGQIEFRKVSLKYSLNDLYVLKGLTFQINQNEKIGIVGRTGAGKSSIIASIFRLVEIEGEIIIDGVNTKDISLKELRSKISLIPQDPVLFSGTLRKNLDPFDEYSDDQLWNVLEEVELKSLISDLPSGLQSTIIEGGSNFSVGQKQLICLARTIIRSNKILILDEATANVDPQTDEFIQTTIRKKFQNCTVLTIAHRLHTVMDSDKILVMDSGRAVEFDHPHQLLQNPKGIFHTLVKQTGQGMTDNLMKIAELSYVQNHSQKI